MLALKKANNSEKAFWKRVIEDLDQEKNDFKKAQSLLAKHNCISETKIIAREYAKEAEEISTNIFLNNKIDNRINSFEIKSNSIKDSSFSIIDAIEKLKLVKSRSEIKRLIKSNGIKINDENYSRSDFSLSKYSSKNEIKISVGKKNFGIIKISKK